MARTTTLDVLIIYNGNIARSSTAPSLNDLTPFSATQNDLNLAYAYFLKLCATHKLSAGFSSSNDITGAGQAQSYWSYQNETWIKNQTTCRSKQIFDKLSPKNAEGLALRNLLFSKSSIKSFNSYSLFKLFFDKQKTYHTLSSFAIPTVTLKNSSVQTVTSAIAKLNKLIDSHSYPGDFTHQIILKDRFGAGGLNIYKFPSLAYSKIQKVISTHPGMSFIIQPLIKFDRGFKYHKTFVSTDIRLIYLNGQVVSSYIRMAKAGDFRCNQHQGGSLVYLKQSQLPKKMITQSKQIARILNKQTSLYTLDFLISNSGNPYLLEGNTGPGITWDQTDKVDQRETKKLIKQIVSDLSKRIKSPPPTPHTLVSKTPFRIQTTNQLYLN